MEENLYLEIQGCTEKLEKIKNAFKDSQFKLLEKNKRYFLKSNRFKECENIEDVLEIGEEFIKVINGIAQINLNLPSTSEIKIIGASIIDNENNIKISYAQSSMAGCLVVKTDLNDENKVENALSEWIHLSEKNENIRKVFRLLNYGLYSYVNLFRIYELIKQDLGDKYTEILGVSEKDISRFTGTSNRPDISGDLSRHGYMKGGPMKDEPMLVDDASIFFYKLIYKWIHHYTKKREDG